MVRTKAGSSSAKAVGAKAPHKVSNTAALRSSGSSEGGGKGRDYSGGNPYHPRETPNWQKPITSFFQQEASKDKEESTASEISASSMDKDIAQSPTEKSDD
ncbi:PCNA-associated factor [Cephus cinctus]|uniref:PCNA-associated factor n=1 Tax=Cephus cinctus TaxID=211228 RepID=A0AAJ7FLS8_CEPCN|nr:PCNA-associated factor [Cephus cinctus]